MTISRSVFIKRYRMQIELAACMDWISQPAVSPPSLEWLAWHPKLVHQHATVKWESFRQEMDGNVFPSLANREGCRQLMREISLRSNFVPEATWLACSSESLGRDKGVGTIQGLRAGPVHGAIQNIGVVEAWRGRGVGKELIRRALRGFYLTGCRMVTLEVTTHNFRAIELYESVGFRAIETVYKYSFFGG
ncbi:MAG: N-acetyltransferase [Planctomycetota bacterium]